MMEGPGADSEEKHEPVSDIDTAVVVVGLKALDPEWPIREAIDRCCRKSRFFQIDGSFPEALVHSAENYIGGHMISASSNRPPPQVLNEALDYKIPVSTGAQGKISVSSFFPFSTASVKLRHRVMSASRKLYPGRRRSVALQYQTQWVIRRRSRLRA
jgi:hypothetical protein